MASSQGTSVSSNSVSRWTSPWYIYSFSNTASCCTFYAFFSSFPITLWPMWLANSKRQPCFYPPQSHAQEDTQTWQTWWETCAVPENIQSSFSCSFTTQLNCSVLLRLYGYPLQLHYLLHLSDEPRVAAWLPVQCGAQTNVPETESLNFIFDIANVICVYITNYLHFLIMFLSF